MILQAFRQHLADELAKFPAKPEEAFESYAVTTAALARQIMAYLEIDDLAVPNGFNDDPPEYPLREVLNRIIHFRVLHPDALTFNYPGKPDPTGPLLLSVRQDDGILGFSAVHHL